MAATFAKRRILRLTIYHILPLLLAFASGVAAGAAEPLTEAVLEVSVNETTGGEALVVLRDAQGHLWLEASDLARLRLLQPAVESHRAQGRDYFPLLAIPGATVAVDDFAQHVTVTAPPVAFGMTRLSAPARRASGLTAADPGAFLNYQLSDQRIAGSNAAGAFVELGAFAAPGVLTNSVVARAESGATRAVRLDTTLTHDFVERLETLNLGDAVSDPGSWGNAVRFAGLRWVRNFAIRPDLVTTPLLTTGGSAVVPAIVDVFVNNQRVSSGSIPPGPFIVDNVPAVSGSGDVRVVVRDALGREQVMTQPFYSGVNMLAAGLSQYALDVGRIREDYALASFHYGPVLTAATYRRGFSDALTLEAHGEFLAGDAGAFGVNGAVRTGQFGILTATLAAGGDLHDHGMLTGLGFERRERDASFVVNTLYASSGFRQIGDTALAGARFKQRTIAQASVSLGSTGSLSLADVLETYRTLPRQNTVSLTHNLSLGLRGSVGLTLSRTTGATASNVLYLSWTMGITDRRAVTVNATAGTRPGAPVTELYATAMQNAPVGPGSGWRVSSGSAGSYDADWRGQFEPLDIELESARTQGTAGSSIFVRGAATYLDGELHAVRAVTSSFAVVDIGVPGVPVYLDNQFVAHTNDHGRAILHNLRAYEDNRISIDPQELPLDTTIGARSVVLAPAFRSGVVARFPVERIHAGTFRLVRDDGSAVPAGGIVELNGASFPVALDGLTYVTSLDGGRPGTAAWGAESCTFKLPTPTGRDLLPDLGTVTCHADQPQQRRRP